MTHAEIFETHPAPGFVPSECPGVLVPEWTRPDVFITHGKTVCHEVTLYGCDLCRAWVVLDVTAGTIRNDYSV